MMEPDLYPDGGNLSITLHAEGQACLSTRPVPSPGQGEILIKVQAVYLTKDSIHRLSTQTSAATAPSVHPLVHTPHLSLLTPSHHPQQASSNPAGFSAQPFGNGNMATQGLGNGGQATQGFPLVPGSDFCGTIVRLGTGVDSDQFRVNQRVAVEPRSFCSTCFYCERGQTNLCQTGALLFGWDIDGGCQQFITVNHKIVHTFSADVPFKQAVLTAPVASVSYGMTKASIFPGDAVLVIGNHLRALLGVTFARCLGADFVCVIGRKGESGAAAVSCGASKYMSLDSTELDSADLDSVIAAVMERTDGRGADAVYYPVECGEDLPLLPLAMACIRPGGCVITARPWGSESSVARGHQASAGNTSSSTSIRAEDAAMDTSSGPSVNHNAGSWGRGMLEMASSKEVRIIGVRGFSSALFDQALRWIEGRLLDLGPVLTHIVPMHSWETVQSSLPSCPGVVLQPNANPILPA